MGAWAKQGEVEHILRLCITIVLSASFLIDVVAAARHTRQEAKLVSLAGLVAVPLPNGARPEGMCSDGASGFYVASLAGQVLHVDGGTNETRVVAREAGVALTGVKYDSRRHRLFTAGALSGSLFVYDLTPGSRVRVAAAAKLLLSPGGYLNDVALGAERVYVSDSFKPLVHSLPRDFELPRNGRPAAEAPGWPPAVARHALGAGFVGVPMMPLLEGANGLAEAAPGVLLVANYKQGQVYALDTRGAGSGGASNSSGGSGASGGAQPVSLGLPAVVAGKRIWPDGLLVTDGGRSLFVADNFNNRLLQVALEPRGAAGAVPRARLLCALMSPSLSTPTTLAEAGGRLWAVNAHLLDCPFVLPCTWQQYSIIGTPLSGLCN